MSLSHPIRRDQRFRSDLVESRWGRLLVDDAFNEQEAALTRAFPEWFERFVRRRVVPAAMPPSVVNIGL
jgi:hypothetical protein